MIRNRDMQSGLLHADMRTNVAEVPARSSSSIPGGMAPECAYERDAMPPLFRFELRWEGIIVRDTRASASRALSYNRYAGCTFSGEPATVGT